MPNCKLIFTLIQGDRLLSERYTARDLDVVSSKYGKTEEEWELTKRQKTIRREPSSRRDLCQKVECKCDIGPKDACRPSDCFCSPSKGSSTKISAPDLHAIGDRGRGSVRVARRSKR